MASEKLLKVANIGLAGFYFVAVMIVSYALISEHESVRWLYFAFPILLTIAYFSPDSKIRKGTSILAITIVVTGGLIEPFELDAIEESFLLLPLCYVILFPGSLWPIAVCFILILCYLVDLPAEAFDEFVEDAIELVFITTFAAVMTYFQQQTKIQAEQYKKASLTDYLTQLPNRKSFFIRLKQLNESGTQETKYAVLQLGLDNLKQVNDNLGYGYGDELLKSFAEMVQEIVADDGEVYRLGGDELVVLLPFLDSNMSPIERIIGELEQGYDTVCQIHNTSHSLRYCGGIALFKDAQNNINVWGKNADAAVAKAKYHRDGTIYWYDDELMNDTIRIHQIEVELKSAIKAQQLYLVYQPKVEVVSGKIVGAEALIRWNHPDLGIVPPNEFISVAERTAQIVPIGRWVIEQAVAQVALWQRQGYELCISINVSSLQFAHDDIYPFIKQTLANASLPPSCLQIEITETAMMDKHSKVAQVCAKLQRLGVTVAIDDFGVAYSSLNYLKKLPIDVLKIDKSFIDECVYDPTDHMIVRTIVQMGHNLGKVVVAEGVETDEQRAILEREQCHQYQGYLYSKPVVAEEFTLLISSRVN